MKKKKFNDIKSEGAVENTYIYGENMSTVLKANCHHTVQPAPTGIHSKYKYKYLLVYSRIRVAEYLTSIWE